MLAVALAIQALVSMAVLAVPAMAPAMAARLDLSPALVGAHVTVVYLAAVLASTAAGPLVLRHGAVRVSQWGLVGCAAGLALTALVAHPAAALVGALAIGLGYGPITPASSHLLARSTPAHRASLVFSIKQTGVPLGGVMAGALVPPMVVAGGVPSALGVAAGACLACALLAQPLRRTLDADRDPACAAGFASLGGPLRLVAAHRALRRLAAVSFVYSAIQTCLAGYLVTYLNAVLGYSLVAAGAALAVAQVGGVVGRVLWGWVADRWLAPGRMLALLGVLMALCSALTAALQAGTPAALVLGLAALFGASATGWNGVYLAEVVRQAPPGQAGTATGGALALTFFGAVVGPLTFAGVAADGTDGFRAAYALLALPALLCAWVLARRVGV